MCSGRVWLVATEHSAILSKTGLSGRLVLLLCPASLTLSTVPLHEPRRIIVSQGRAAWNRTPRAAAPRSRQPRPNRRFGNDDKPPVPVGLC